MSMYFAYRFYSLGNLKYIYYVATRRTRQRNLENCFVIRRTFCMMRLFKIERNKILFGEASG